MKYVESKKSWKLVNSYIFLIMKLTSNNKKGIESIIF